MQLFRAFAAWHRQAHETESAAAVAFWVLLSLGPAGIVAINVLGLFVDQRDVADHLASLALASPGTFGDLLVGQFAEVAQPSPGTVVTDMILVLVSLWTISAAVAMLLRGLRRGYGLPRDRFSIVRAGGALMGMAAILALGAMSFTLDTDSPMMRVMGALAAFALSTLVIAGLHRLATSGHIPWRTIWPGAALGAIGCVIIQSSYENVVGALPLAPSGAGRMLAGLVTSMLALWLAGLIVLWGPFVNTRPWLRPTRNSPEEFVPRPSG